MPAAPCFTRVAPGLRDAAVAEETQTCTAGPPTRLLLTAAMAIFFGAGGARADATGEDPILKLMGSVAEFRDATQQDRPAAPAAPPSVAEPSSNGNGVATAIGDAVERLMAQLAGVAVGGASEMARLCRESALADRLVAEAQSAFGSDRRLAFFLDGVEAGAKRAGTENPEPTAEQCATIRSRGDAAGAAAVDDGPQPIGAAVERRDWKTCRTIAEDDARLACFDAVSGALIGFGRGSTRIGAWTVTFSDDDAAIETHGDRHLIGPQTTRPLLLRIACTDSRQTMMSISMDGVGWSNDYAMPSMVSMSVDGGAAQASEWSQSPFNTSALFPGGEEVLIPFLHSLARADAETLTARMTVTNAPESVVTFPLHGIADALAPVAQRCYWR